jgi:SH3 domain protein
VKSAAAWVLLLLSGAAAADTAFVTDELVLGVYAEQNNQGQRLATLHSGASVETLSVEGDFTQVRLSDGTTGWVKSSFLTMKPPAVVRIKQLEQELDRSRATTPGLTEDSARNEVAQLQRALADKQTELEAARAELASKAPETLPFIPAAWLPWIVGAGILAAISLGFWLGYATLAKRVKDKFGGIKVY